MASLPQCLESKYSCSIDCSEDHRRGMIGMSQRLLPVYAPEEQTLACSLLLCLVSAAHNACS